jgi:hypothetical protein
MPEKASEEQIFGIIEILKAKGNTAAVSAILDAQEVLVDFDRYDNWNGGLYNVSIIVKMDHYGYGCLKSEDLIRLKEAIGEAAEPVLDLGQNDTFTGVTIRPAAAVKLGWREDTAAWLRGSGVTNQGRVRSDNVAAKEFDGLLFRSQPKSIFTKLSNPRASHLLLCQSSFVAEIHIAALSPTLL